MKIYFRGRMYEFRACDVKGMTEAHVITRADKCGEILYDYITGNTWLFVRGIGYALEVN